MSKKNKPDTRGFVFSTDPNFRFEEEPAKNQQILPPEQQKIKIRMETKHRAGKAVTLVTGFTGSEEELENLSKKLKNFCGTGGSAKDNEIIIQGDQRDKVLQWLLQNRFILAKKI